LEEEIRDLKQNIASLSRDIHKLREDVATSWEREDGRYYIVEDLHELKYKEELFEKELEKLGEKIKLRNMSREDNFKNKKKVKEISKL